MLDGEGDCAKCHLYWWCYKIPEVSKSSSLNGLCYATHVFRIVDSLSTAIHMSLFIMLISGFRKLVEMLLPNSKATQLQQANLWLFQQMQHWVSSFETLVTTWWVFPVSPINLSEQQALHLLKVKSMFMQCTTSHLAVFKCSHKLIDKLVNIGKKKSN